MTDREPDSPCVASNEDCPGVYLVDGCEQSCDRCNHVAREFEPLNDPTQ
jgi:hypothetical protein